MIRFVRYGLALAAVAMWFVCGCGGARIERVRDGVVRSGSYVPDKAYASALAGVIAEERGDYASARKHYQEAMSHSGDGWLSARVDGLPKDNASARERSPASSQPQALLADVLSIAITKPATDIGFLEASDAVADHPALRAWLLDQAIAKMVLGERAITTTRIANAIVAMAKNGPVVLASALAEKLVLRAHGPYGDEATSWLIVRLAADEAIEAGHTTAWATIHARGRISFREMASRARLLHATGAARALTLSKPKALGEEELANGANADAATWMLMARNLCVASPEAFAAWNGGKKPRELERDPQFAAFTKTVPCYEASRRQSTAKAGRSNER